MTGTARARCRGCSACRWASCDRTCAPDSSSPRAGRAASCDSPSRTWCCSAPRRAGSARASPPAASARRCASCARSCPRDGRCATCTSGPRETASWSATARASGAPRMGRSSSISAPRRSLAALRRWRARRPLPSTRTDCTSAAAIWRRPIRRRRGRRTSVRWSWIPATATRTSTWAGCCTRRARQPARRSTTGAPSRSGPRTAPPRSTSASPWRTWGGARRPSTRTGWRSPPTRTAPMRTTTSRASTSTWGKERRRCATCARTARSPATPDARPVRDERLQLRAVARPVLPGGPAEDEDAPVLCVSLRHGGDQLQLLPQADREAARRLGGAGAGALPFRAQGVAAHHAPRPAARAGAGLGVRGRGPDPGRAPRADPVPAAAEPESRRAAPAGLPPPPAARPAGGVRVPPRELVRRRHLPGPAGLRRGTVPRRERRAGDAARAHRSVRVPPVAPHRVRRGAPPGLGRLGTRRGIRAGRLLLLQARGRGAGPALRTAVPDSAHCVKRLLLRARADLGARVQLGDRLADVARVGGRRGELEVLLVRPAGGFLVVAHQVRDAEPAPGHGERGVVRERLLELLGGGLVAPPLQLEIAPLDLGLGDGAGELGGRGARGRRGRGRVDRKSVV